MRKFSQYSNGSDGTPTTWLARTSFKFVLISVRNDGRISNKITVAIVVGWRLENIPRSRIISSLKDKIQWKQWRTLRRCVWRSITMPIISLVNASSEVQNFQVLSQSQSNVLFIKTPPRVSRRNLSTRSEIDYRGYKKKYHCRLRCPDPINFLRTRITNITAAVILKLKVNFITSLKHS